MIIFVIILLVIFYFIIHFHIHSICEERIQIYAKIVDDVFYEKDQKMEDLQYKINLLEMDVRELQEKLSKRNL